MSKYIIRKPNKLNSYIYIHTTIHIPIHKHIHIHIHSETIL